MEEYRLDGLTIKEHLLEMELRGNKPFAEKLNPGVPHVLGLRMPELRSLARCISHTDWECYFRTADTFYMEERMLYGMVLGCICPDADVEDYLRRVTSFVWMINSWSVCDAFKLAGGKKFVEENRKRLWEYFTDWLRSGVEYEKRFGIVMLMRYFITDEYIDRLLDVYDKVDSGERFPSSSCTPESGVYYVKMALAWALSECFIKFPIQTTEYLKHSSFDDFIYNKTLQKITESYRVSEDGKSWARSMKRK